MNILITNDDGIHAEGIKALAFAAVGAGHNVTVVAPDREKSACSHALTMDLPLTARDTLGYPKDIEAYAITGTPADCVKIGMLHLIDEKIDVVLSGINIGANLGSDIVYSGTVNAAIEANMLGIPAIAFSQALIGRKQVDYTTYFKTAARCAMQLIEKIDVGNMQDFIYNVNFPAVIGNEIKGIKFCSQGVSAYDEAYEKRTDPFGRDYYWIGGKMIESEYNEVNNTDVKWIDKGYITITPLKWNQTDLNELEHSKCKIENLKLHF
ncbi:MAG: 5'/3'-nucleotidase SurE [Christensenella sp.]